LESAILPQILAIELHFARKGCDWTREIAILPQFLTIELHFVRKGCDWTREIAIAVFDDRTSFRAKGLAGRLANRNFTAVFGRSDPISCETVAFRAVSLALPRAFKREIEKKERARGQESKRARENVKM